MKILKTFVVVLCGLAVSIGLSGCEKKTSGPDSEIYSSIYIFVVDELGYPVSGATVTTLPSTVETVTDEEGRAVIDSILVRPYQVFVRDGNLIGILQNVVPEADQPLIVQIVLITEPPKVTILQPRDNDFKPAYNVLFSGSGTDNEDGLLPDSALVWISDIDGELGRGRTITVDSLTEGLHYITLEGTDSDNKKGRDFVQFMAVDYSPDSYFPLPLGGSWTYRHPKPNITVMNEVGQTEYWYFKELTVSVDYLKRRSGLILYDIRTGTVTRHIRYHLMDYLEKEAGNIYVTKTVEQMTVWTGDEIEGPQTEQLDIITLYTPRYIILKNLTDPITEGSYETTVRANITRTYTSSLGGSETYQESFNVTTSVEVGEVERVITGLGTFSALGLTFYQEGSVRKWWLVAGLGLVRLEYNTLPPYPIATIYDTNLLPFYREVHPQKPTIDTFLDEPPPLIKTPRIPQGNFEDMVEFCRFFKTLCPR